jgi:hypothetical protein
MNDGPKIVHIGTGQRATDVANEMAERIKEVIYEYSERTTLATAVGVLHIVAKELLDDHD